MCSVRSAVCLSFIGVVAPSVAPALAHEESVIVIGRNAAGQIVVDADYPQPLELPVSIFPGISGYATGLLGVHSVSVDNPTNDFFQLSTAADLRFVLLAKDPGMEVWNDHGSGFLNVGEPFFIGSAPFDTHPLWNLVTGTLGNAYSLALKVYDLTGTYSESDPVTLSFTPAPPPRYSINLFPVDSGHAELSWPTNAMGWVPQSSDFLTTTNWDTITNAPAVSGTNFSLTISTACPQRFFRLLKN